MISICVPTYEMKGEGDKYLDFSFNILYQQTYQDFEIIISDHSKSNIIKNLCKQWENILNINYYHNPNNIGNSSANINNAIKNSKGDIIKILFQDDFLYDEYSLEKQLDYFKSDWLVTSCCHYDGENIYKPFHPQYHDNIQYGHNTISSPSVLMFKNKNTIEFDENLIWLMDVDYYKRLFDKFGLPDICPYISVVNREHPNQVSNTLATEEIKQNELNYIIKKYG